MGEMWVQLKYTNFSYFSVSHALLWSTALRHLQLNQHTNKSCTKCLVLLAQPEFYENVLDTFKHVNELSWVKSINERDYETWLIVFCSPSLNV